MSGSARLLGAGDEQIHHSVERIYQLAERIEET